MEILRGYEISTERERLDIGVIHEFLSTSYWAAGRSRETVERSIAHSLCFGVYNVAAPTAPQVGFARVITDHAVFGYLADVFVLPDHRGRGIATAMMRAIVAHPELQTLSVFLLRTRDAHRLYEPFGFTAVPSPGELLGRY